MTPEQAQTIFLKAMRQNDTHGCWQAVIDAIVAEGAEALNAKIAEAEKALQLAEGAYKALLSGVLENIEADARVH